MHTTLCHNKDFHVYENFKILYLVQGFCCGCCSSQSIESVGLKDCPASTWINCRYHEEGGRVLFQNVRRNVLPCEVYEPEDYTALKLIQISQWYIFGS